MISTGLGKESIDFQRNSKGFGKQLDWFLKDLVRNWIDFQRIFQGCGKDSIDPERISKGYGKEFGRRLSIDFCKICERLGKEFDWFLKELVRNEIGFERVWSGFPKEA